MNLAIEYDDSNNQIYLSNAIGLRRQRSGKFLVSCIESTENSLEFLTISVGAQLDQGFSSLFAIILKKIALISP